MLNTRSLTRRRTRTGRTRPGVAAGLTIGSVLLGGGMFLAGCSAASSNSAGSNSASSSTAAGTPYGAAAKAASGQSVPAPALAPVASAAAGSAPGGQGGAGTTARLAPASSIIYTAQLTVRADDVGPAAAQAAQIAEGAGGYVSSETLLGPKAKPLVQRPKAPPSLAGGFGAGWRALRITVSWTLAFLGAIAPFAAVAAIAGYVIYRGRRRLIRRRPAAPSASPES